MEKKFKILEHPADVKIQAFGKDKKELFLNAMLGMVAVLRPQIRNSNIKTRNIKIKSVDFNALLVDFLNEVLYLAQTNKEIYNKIKFKEFSDVELEGELFGNKVESFEEDIKAVTYHGLKIEKNKNGSCQATILFDI